MAEEWISLILPALSLNKTVCRGILGFDVATQGSGPCDEVDFDIFLTECGISPRTIQGDHPPSVVVLGRDDWVPADLDELQAIKQRREGETRVYSQEMVLASLAIGADVIDVLDGDTVLDAASWDCFIFDHPALSYFYSCAAPPQMSEDPWGSPTPAGAGRVAVEDLWGPPPSALAAPARLAVDFDSGAWPSSGVLSQMGYHVGQSGLVPDARRAILQQVLGVELVAVSPDSLSYIEEWGPPQSRQRLQKMINCLVGFSYGARRRPGDYSEAIADWESDLQWLRGTFSP